MPKKSPLWSWMLVGLLLIAISSYIRLYPLRAHLWDDAREQATLLVIYKIKQTLFKEIISQEPQMPPALADHWAQEKLNTLIHTDNQQFMHAVEKAADALAQAPGAKASRIYLLESDPFDFYNLTENIVHSGRIAEIIKGSKYFNPLMCAPFGCWQPFTLHPYWGFLIYKVLRVLNPTISLMSAVAFTPLWTYAFIVIAFLWVCRIYNYSLLASAIGTLFLVMAPINLKRGSLGWFRTDPYNILFPLLILGCLCLIFKASSRKESLIKSMLLGALLSVYALFWQGWGLLFFIDIVCTLSVALYHRWITQNFHRARQNLLSIPIFVLSSLVLIGLCFSFQDFFILFKEGFGELHKFTHRGLDLWPNLFMAVGELKKPSLAQITNSAGGILLIITAVCGWIYSVWLMVKNPRRLENSSTLVVSIFLSVTLLLSLNGERFVLFATIPLSVLAAAAIEGTLRWRKIGIGVSILMAVLIVHNADRNIRTILTPIFNSAWDEALTSVKNHSPQDSTVNTWWAPGHFIKGIANRRVPFDGASLDQSAVGYWMANMFLSPDENQARGILRMLNSSGNKPAEYLQRCGLKLSDAVSLLLAIAGQNRSQAALTLKGIITDKQIKNLLALTHAQTPHSYVLVYTELVDDNLMLAFSGHWNIKKMEDFNANPNLLKETPNPRSPDFINFLWDTMGGPPKYSEALALLGRQGNHLLFNDHLTIDLTTMKSQIESSQYGTGQPASVFYLKNGRLQEQLNPEGNLNYTVVLYQEDGQYIARLMDHATANSLIMKLYYFDGKGLEYFKPLVLSRDLTGRTRIKVFEVNYKD